MPDSVDIERLEGTLHRGTMLNDQLSLQVCLTLIVMLKSKIAPILLKHNKLYPKNFINQSNFEDEEEEKSADIDFEKYLKMRDCDVVDSADEVLMQTLAQAMMSLDLCGDLASTNNQIVRQFTFKVLCTLLLIIGKDKLNPMQTD